jgi:hypothetical protein
MPGGTGGFAAGRHAVATCKVEDDNALPWGCDRVKREEAALAWRRGEGA